MKKLLLALTLITITFCLQAVSRFSEPLLRNAQEGNVSAQYNIGLAYLEGSGIQQDYQEALRRLRLH
jgi:TPR repeat protein